MSTIPGFGSPLPVDSKWQVEKPKETKPVKKPVKKSPKKPENPKKITKKVRKEDLPWN